MLNNASGFRKVYIAAGYTDLRRGIDGLASIVKFNFQLEPYEKDILFLFCGRRSDRIKGLIWEGDRFLLLYKRLELGSFSWPRTKEEALEITLKQYQALMQGRPVSSHSFNQEYFTAISCCVDKYSEKPKKLLVFPVFQSVYPLVRMTNLLFYPVRFFFWFAVQ